ncbi:hypothetical protein VOLCADRAFT_58668 [Volvox carteri f. nagariensis]|uniref:GDP-D-glucose phosphorylase 1 n=1 Tax=Volvox carteri f. nagariensis TaxID=3068 RepID=D8TQR4_VOLCA|nr:uncharacterized protein VOLCADRAFT_58668 [Volvox carteri f. nagariensis]EFJ50199.1 hypothetical protein VOLCADRAFT_58668 [Volvox carteri f. nagariensis]|eukprot:XP_002948819.1 hypothetical protein VOLCADRAFT_58668 [Volvox carteri f. nagariensis]
MGSSLADDCSSYSAFSSSIAVSGSEDGKVLEVPSRSLLESALMTLWEDRADRGLFRYDVTLCPTRVLPGSRGFIAQLNEGRATKKRPTEVTLDRVLQPFDSAKFNFKKAAMAEALVGFFPDDAGSGGGAGGGNGGRSLLPSVAPLGAAAVAAGGSPNLVLINVSPIDYGHVLLVPRVLDNLPQALSCGTVLLALQFAGELGNSHFRVGYNSLGAYATINHLHFQSYFLAKTMPCEAAATVPLPGVGVLAGAAVRVSRLVDYPVNAFVIEALTSLETSLYDCAERLQAANQPFNLLISDAGRRVFLFPQCFAERQAAGLIPPELLETGVNPAAFEIAGHLVLKRTQDYTEATEDLAMQLLAQASLSEERFMSLARLCFGGAAGADICGAALQ